MEQERVESGEVEGNYLECISMEERQTRALERIGDKLDALGFNVDSPVTGTGGLNQVCIKLERVVDHLSGIATILQRRL